MALLVLKKSLNGVVVGVTKPIVLPSELAADSIRYTVGDARRVRRRRKAGRNPALPALRPPAAPVSQLGAPIAILGPTARLRRADASHLDPADGRHAHALVAVSPDRESPDPAALELAHEDQIRPGVPASNGLPVDEIRKARGGFWLPASELPLDTLLLVESAVDAFSAARWSPSKVRS